MFPGCNLVFKPPQGREDIRAVPAFVTKSVAVTAWKLDPEAIAEIQRTGIIHLAVLCGGQMPASFLGSERQVREVIADYGPVFPRTPA